MVLLVWCCRCGAVGVVLLMLCGWYGCEVLRVVLCVVSVVLSLCCLCVVVLQCCRVVVLSCCRVVVLSCCRVIVL